jgi:hypothetical protein
VPLRMAREVQHGTALASRPVACSVLRSWGRCRRDRGVCGSGLSCVVRRRRFGGDRSCPLCHGLDEGEHLLGSACHAVINRDIHIEQIHHVLSRTEGRAHQSARTMLVKQRNRDLGVAGEDALGHQRLSVRADPLEQAARHAKALLRGIPPVAERSHRVLSTRAEMVCHDSGSLGHGFISGRDPEDSGGRARAWRQGPADLRIHRAGVGQFRQSPGDLLQPLRIGRRRTLGNPGPIIEDLRAEIFHDEFRMRRRRGATAGCASRSPSSRETGPISTTSSAVRTQVSMRLPLTKVPLLLPRSVITH